MAGQFINLKPFSRFIHSTCYNFANIHKTFRKVIASNSSRKKKMNFDEFPILPNTTNFKQVEEKKFKPIFRRVNVLNKMFMEYVTDLIVNGEHWEKYTNLGIEITKVEISRDYKRLNIFWISKETGNEKDIMIFLTENTFTLRHELSQLNVIGMVPPISFVKDKSHTQLKELDRRMAQADYGDDYEALSVSRLKHQLELYCPLEENIKSQLKKLEAENEEPLDVDLPEMPQNVLGLDHDSIMKKIKNPKNIRTANISGGRRLASSNEEELEDLSSRDAFKMFLQKRQIMEQKMMKEDKNYNVDMEYMKEALNKSFEEHYDNIEENLDKFEDFIEDESEER